MVFQAMSHKKKLCGNAVIVESMEKSHDFPTLPTMTWKSLRLSHIPTKTTTVFIYLLKTQKPKNLECTFKF